MSRTQSEEFRAFWGGPPLTAYEELSLTSVVSRGHHVMLYSYDKALRVPAGVELLSAEEILPGTIHEFVYPNGDRSIALQSDLFRYEVLRRYGGWYFDLDIVLLSEDLPSDPIFLARQDKHFVNAAVMKFSPDHPLMKLAADNARSLVDSCEWGSIGPRLLTRLVNDHGMGHLLSPQAAAFVIQPDDVPLLFMPEHRAALEGRVSGANFVHLWNEIWRRARVLKGYGPPEGSFLDVLFRRFGITVPPAGRLSAQAVESWFREMHLVRAIKQMYGEDFHTRDLAIGIEKALWEREYMLRSLSWRVTVPLRWLIKTVRRVSAATARWKLARRNSATARHR